MADQSVAEAASARLGWLRAELDGVLYERAEGALRPVVAKAGGQVALYFRNPDGSLDGPMSRVELARPLALLAEYTQALALALLWQPRPQRIAVVGYGGGRLPLALRAALPEAEQIGVDIDPLLFELADRYFGTAPDPRERRVVGDGRAALAEPGPPIGLILLDAFSDQSDALDHLGTLEFFQLCRARLTQDGAAALNLLRSDARLDAKVAAFAASFASCAALPLKHSLVLIGAARARFPLAQAARRAEQLARQIALDPPLTAHAAGLRPLRPAELGLRRAAPLRDADLQSSSHSR